MLNHQCGYLFAVSQLFLVGSSLAAPSTNSIYDWTGFYLGLKTGAVFSSFSAKTTTQPGAMFSTEDADVVKRFGDQKLTSTGFISGIEGGYNWRFNRFLLGLETDIQSLNIDKMKHSGAIPYDNNNAQFVITSYADNNWLFTARPRLGLIADNWLLYATGGLSLAFLHGDFLFTNNLGSFESQRVRQMKPGYTVGAGVESSLTNHISLKAEYLFNQFNNSIASQMSPTTPTDQTFSNSINLKSNLINIGLNYHIDNQLPNPLFSSLPFDLSQWKTELGTRLFFSTGLVGAPQPLFNSTSIGNILASRLTYSNLSAISEEIFARIDHPSGLFAKGYLGAGSINSGQLNDEDFPAGGDVYSNTLSNAWGSLSYGTIDLGYAFLKNAAATTGAFIGYNYYSYNINTYNCTQLAGSSTCVPSTLLNNFLALSENDTFNSLRLGLSSNFNLNDQWTLTSEAAYLPLVHFKGLDMHNARELVIPEAADFGDGAMLEAILNYQLNDSWGMGLGGRYWTWNMHNGHVLFDFLGEDVSIKEPARFNAERYGVFLQVNYHTQPSHETRQESDPLNWKGFFVGGSLGGAMTNSYWTNPFGSFVEPTDYVNIAGFGNQIKTSGPLGGMELHINWQTGRLLYGIAGSFSSSDIRGENTVFSGIGGTNGREKSNTLGTLVGRIGTTFNRSLLYLNAGRAVLNTQYSLLGNTGILNLGAGEQTLSTWGWTGGVGVEYALTDSWNTSIEYDYIRLPNQKLSFPTVEFMSNQTISEHRNMGVFKLGINYKLIP